MLIISSPYLWHLSVTESYFSLHHVMADSRREELR